MTKEDKQLSINELSSSRCFNGFVKKIEHDSKATGCTMKVSLYVPDIQPKGFVLWLSGLTCNEDNFITKSGATRVASELGLILVCPDTSPRGTNFPGEHDDWDFGSGAGFYVDATEAPWNKNYNMFSYTSKELPDMIEGYLGYNKLAWAISGHSMGGHGALVIGMRSSDKFKSISAFSPIVSPTQCQWGVKAFSNYLGQDKTEWKAYDACELMSNSNKDFSILVDQGTDDPFLKEQLLTDNFIEVSKKSPVTVNLREGFDHSYFFISSFIEEHLNFHLKNLK